MARASFYRNYATKESVITTLIADVLEDFRAGLPGDGEDFYTLENIRRSFDYFSRYAQQVLYVGCNDGDACLLSKLCRRKRLPDGVPGQ